MRRLPMAPSAPVGSVAFGLLAMLGVLGVLGALGALLAPAPAAAETLWIEAGLVIPVDGEPIPGGRVVVEDGEITAVGADVERPPFSRRLDALHLVVTPGFVVPATRIGLPSPQGSSGGSSRTKISMESKASGADEHFPPHRAYSLLLREGITTIGLLPGASAPGVQGLVSAASTLEPEDGDAVLEKEAALLIDVAAHAPWREKVGKAFDAIVEKVEEERAKEAKEKQRAERRKKKGRKSSARAGAGGSGKGGGEDDALTRAVKGEIPVFLDMGTGAAFVAAIDELPLEAFDLVVLDAGRTHELTDELKKLDARILTWPALVRLPRTRIPINRAAEYEAAAIPYAFRLPSDSVEGARDLRAAAIEMVRTGASAERVLSAMTLEAARVLGVEEQVGAVAKGRRADLAFWTNHPLDPLARLDRVMVGGEWIEPVAGVFP